MREQNRRARGPFAAFLSRGIVQHIVHRSPREILQELQHTVNDDSSSSSGGGGNRKTSSKKVLSLLHDLSFHYVTHTLASADRVEDRRHTGDELLMSPSVKTLAQILLSHLLGQTDDRRLLKTVHFIIQDLNIRRGMYAQLLSLLQKEIHTRPYLVGKAYALQSLDRINDTKEANGETEMTFPTLLFLKFCPTIAPPLTESLFHPINRRPTATKFNSNVQAVCLT